MEKKLTFPFIQFSEDDTAFDEGVKAYKDGKFKICPYKFKDDPKRYNDWIVGYNCAKNKDY